MQKGKFNSVVDASWGSSGKGAVATRITDIFGVKNVSSGNFPNAGHTAIVQGTKFVSKALPTPLILNKFGKKLTGWVGPASSFQREQFEKEMQECSLSFSDLVIHERAMITEQRHIDAESPGGNQSTEHVSSTMSGSGASAADKLMRGKEVKLARDFYETASPMNFMYAVRKELQAGNGFLHEVSQGFALSINYGTQYPNCTFRDCTPQQAYADFGILPSMVGDVYLNVRAMPIRVGNNFRDGKQTGYSGDFLSDQQELTWEQVAQMSGMPEEEARQLAERERTTVTKKIRRVATQSWTLCKQAADFCGATKVVLNFPQYIHWSAHKVRGGKKEFETLHEDVRKYVDKLQESTNLPVVMICTGAEHEDYIWLE
jgi:adenylosuccinate synthase